MSFRLTYATMFDPPPEMHERFDAALVTVRSTLGGRHPLFLHGGDTPAEAIRFPQQPDRQRHPAR